MDLKAGEEGGEILILLEESFLWNALTVNDVILLLKVFLKITSRKAVLFILIVDFFLKVLFVDEVGILLVHSFVNDQIVII